VVARERCRTFQVAVAAVAVTNYPVTATGGRHRSTIADLPDKKHSARLFASIILLPVSELIFRETLAGRQLPINPITV